jgi:Tol biopolymer transport system component/DNA-binding winged helix-turn-helix (wHTH) protein
MIRRYRFDDVEIDLQSFRLLKGGKVVQVEPKALNLLIFLVERSGQLVPRREIIDAVWKEAFVTDHVLNRIIGQLRKGLSDDAHEPRYIETVPTLGYRFIAEVKAKSEVPAPSLIQSGGSSDTPAAAQQNRPPSRISSLAGRIWGTRWLKVAVQTVAVLALALAISVEVIRGWPRFEFYRPGYAAQITNFQGLSNYPAFSPDDTTIAYSRDDGNGFEIFVRQLAPEGREIQITSDGGQNLEAAWSPDGKLIAYYSYAREGIWLVSPFGGLPRQLTQFGSHPSWSPDHQWIVFQSNPISNLSFEGSGFARGSVLWMIHPDGTGEKQLTFSGAPAGGHGDPSWSLDGKRVVFQVENEPYEGLWSIASDGTGLVNLTPNGCPFLPHDPIYSPDGKSVLYGGAQGLWQIHVSPGASAPLGEPVQISNSGGMVFKNLAISRDGKKLLYAAEIKTSSLQSLDLSPSGQPIGAPATLRPDAGCRTTLPEFSPDGKLIAFYSCRAGSPGEIWQMEANGSNARQLTSIPADYSAPSWYPDGRHILYLTGDSEQFKLFSIDSETRQQQQVGELHQQIDRVALSPDGKQVVFDATTDGVWNIWLMDLANGKTKQVTFGHDHLAYPLWSKDGKFLSADLEHGVDTNLAIFPASGGPVTQMTFDRGDNWSGSWSQDGDQILLARRPSSGPWNIWSISRSTKVEKQITHYSKLNIAVYAPAISPRGDQIVYEYSEINGNIWMLDLDHPK